MAGIRIRTGGVEIDVDDEVALAEMRAKGLLGSDAEKLVAGAWTPLSLPQRRPAAAGEDPWAAWNGFDDQAADSLLTKLQNRSEEEPAELPTAAVAPMAKPIVVQPRPLPSGSGTARLRPPRNLATMTTPPPEEGEEEVDSLPALGPDAIELVTASPRPAPAMPEPTPPRSLPPFMGGADGGELIDFPRRPSPPRTLRAPPPEPTPLVRPWRVLGMILAGLAVVGGAIALGEMSRPLSQPVSSVSQAPGKRPATVDPLLALERELRGAPLGDVRPVRKQGDLGDALLIELQKLRVDVVSVDARVTQWNGRKEDNPAAAEVHVTFAPGEQADERALGAIALVVGRYKLKYTLDISVIEAIKQAPDGPLATTLDPARCGQFAQGRIGLSALLAPK